MAVAMDDPMAGGSVYQMDKTLGRKMDSLSAACLAAVMDDLSSLSGYSKAGDSVLMNLTAVSLDVTTALDCLLTAVVTAPQFYLAEKTDEVMVLSLATAMDEMSERMLG